MKKRFTTIFTILGLVILTAFQANAQNVDAILAVHADLEVINALPDNATIPGAIELTKELMYEYHQILAEKLKDGFSDVEALNDADAALMNNGSDEAIIEARTRAESIID